MANENNEEKPYSFVEEKILPKKKKKLKKILFTAVQAVIFGFVSCLVFVGAHPYITKWFGHGEEQIKLSMATSTPTPSASPVVTVTPKPSEEPDNKMMTSGDVKEIHCIYQKVAAEVNDSIVTVTMVKKGVDALNNSYENTNTTSGMIVANSSENILILVNYSRVKNCNKIEVTFPNNETVSGSLFNYSQELGIAVVSVPVEKLSEECLEQTKAVKLGESYVLDPGDPVIALGNPNGYMYSMDQGIITNKVQSAYITDHRIELFNTSIADNNNGDGIIINLQGEVIGLISHSFKKNLNSNINTCLAISSLKPSLERILNKTQMVYFGVVANDITSEVAPIVGVDKGVYVTKVVADSPAFTGGIIQGDVIQSVNGTEIASMGTFSSQLSERKKDDKVDVKIVRTTDNNKEMTVKVTLKTH